MVTIWHCRQAGHCCRHTSAPPASPQPRKEGAWLQPPPLESTEKNCPDLTEYRAQNTGNILMVNWNWSTTASCQKSPISGNDSRCLDLNVWDWSLCVQCGECLVFSVYPGWSGVRWGGPCQSYCPAQTGREDGGTITPVILCLGRRLQSVPGIVWPPLIVGILF